ncbi:unnamed protein product [Alopecurus aequalis]
MPTPMLPDELLEEIFLRLPPDEPACLVRASLASKIWLGLLTGAAFRGRYIDFHGAPPMLGFLLSYSHHEEKHPTPHFVSTAKFGARIPRRSEYDTLYCRHGRVLLADTSTGPSELAVWNPMTGYWRAMEAPGESLGLGAAVLCAVAGCDHRSCHDGPFQVILCGLSTNDIGAEQRSAHAWVYSSETEAWSEPCSALQLGSAHALIDTRPSVLFENTLYHTVLYADHISILKYDMGSNCMSLLDGPPVAPTFSAILLTLEDGSLGFAYLHYLSLYLWSRPIRFDGAATWNQSTVVHLEELLPVQNPKERLRLVGFKEKSDVVFVTTDLGIYEISFKSLEWKRLWERAKIRALIPYMSFYYPSGISIHTFFCDMRTILM